MHIHFHTENLRRPQRGDRPRKDLSARHARSDPGEHGDPVVYRQTISPKKMGVFNDNHYLASAIYRLTLTCLETLLYHKL